MKFNADITKIATQIVYGLIILIVISLLIFGFLLFTENLLTTVLVYYVGFILAYVIAYRNIKKFKTSDNPWFAAAFSWITVVLFISACLYRLSKGIKSGN